MYRQTLPVLLLVVLAGLLPLQNSQAAGQVSIQTDAGTFTLEVDPDPSGTTPLQGVAFTAELPAGDGILHLRGYFSEGELVGDLLSGQALGELDEVYQSDPFGNSLVISQAKAELQIINSSLQAVQLSEMHVALGLPFNGQQPEVNGMANGVLTNGGISFQGTLSLGAAFNYQRGSVTAAMKPGDVFQVFVNQGAFVGAVFQAVDLTVQIPLGGEMLMATGVSNGGINAAGGIDLVGTLGLDKPLEYEKGEVKATLDEGIGVEVEVVDSSLRRAELNGAKVIVTFPAPAADLVLGGETDVAVKEDGLSFTALLTVLEPFIYTKGDVSATLNQGGTVQVTVENSQFKFAELTNLDVAVDVVIGDDTLQLGGSVDTGMGPDQTIDFTAQLNVLEPFVYKKGDVSATLNQGGTVQVTVENSQFKFAELTNLDVAVDVVIGDDTLQLGGSVDTGMGPDQTIDFAAQLNVLEPFVYKKGDVSATLNQGGTVQVTVESSQFKFAELTNLNVAVDVVIGDDTLQLGGSVDTGMGPDQAIDFAAQLNVLEPFVYKKGDVSATLDQGGAVNVVVEKSTFAEAQLPGIEISVATSVRGALLSLAGHGDVQLGADGGLTFNGDLTLVEDFNYVQGKLKAKIQSGGTLAVRIRGSRFLRANLADQAVLVELVLPDSQPAIMKGNVLQGSISRWFITLRAQVMLETHLTLGSRWWKRTVEPGEGVLSILPFMVTFKGDGGSFVVILSS